MDGFGLLQMTSKYISKFKKRVYELEDRSRMTWRFYIG
jgi:hypothetical protein